MVSKRSQEGRKSELKRNDSEEMVEQFINAVKNHTVYRRDNLVRKMANQTKQSFDPYLRFQ